MNGLDNNAVESSETDIVKSLTTSRRISWGKLPRLRRETTLTIRQIAKRLMESHLNI